MTDDTPRFVAALATKPLTAQERELVTLVAQGIKPSTAASRVGMSPSTALEKLRQPHIATVMAHLRENQMQTLGFEVNRDWLTLKLLEAHAKSGSATEEIAALREIGKVHGLYAPEAAVVRHEHVHDIKQLEHLSDEELVRKAQLRVDSLKAQPIVYTPAVDEDADA